MAYIESKMIESVDPVRVVEGIKVDGPVSLQLLAFITECITANTVLGNLDLNCLDHTSETLISRETES